jgi:hypothetical protein
MIEPTIKICVDRVCTSLSGYVNVLSKLLKHM